ncbi:MAG: MFS transporter [Dongiaceae bacterium]
MDASEIEAPPHHGLLAKGRWPVLLLICGGIWLHAADTTVVATIMPDAVTELGGLAWVAWAWMLELVGAIVAAAACGFLAARYGTGRMTGLAAGGFAIGCMVTALSWDMGGFLAGRLLQGIGGGAMVALCHIGVAACFPERLWIRAYAMVAIVWGTSALIGPLVGGFFAEIGFWRGAFWAFAAQALLIVIAAPALLRRATAHVDRNASGVPVRSLLFLVPAVLVIGLGGVVEIWWVSLLAVLLGIALLAACLIADRRGPVSLLPRESLGVPRVSAGLLMAFLLPLSAISFSTYGPLLLQRLHGLSPLQFGYLAALESVAWSLTALFIARWPLVDEQRCIRVGGFIVVAAIGLFAYAMPRGSTGLVVVAALMQGGGFGLCWAYVTRRVVAAALPVDRERAAGALPTVQMLGYAVGAAAAGIVANGLGFASTGRGGDADRIITENVAVWVFLAFIPLGLGGIAAAWRLSRP